MFKQRLMTALFLIPLVLFTIYYANDWVLAGVITVILLALGWEWTVLIPIQRREMKVALVAMVLVLTWFMGQFLMHVMLINALLWLAILAAIVTYPKSLRFWGFPVVVGALAWFVLAVFGSSFWALYHSEQGPNLLVYLLCLVWATDIGAYFAGKIVGKHRLIPKVSPGKTIEGVLGGLGLAFVVVGVGVAFFHPSHVILWFVQAFVLIVISIVGDLFISMLKRRCHVKDTGHLLPGHGGVLDRLDSLIATLPFFYYFYQSIS